MVSVTTELVVVAGAILLVRLAEPTVVDLVWLPIRQLQGAVVALLAIVMDVVQPAHQAGVVWVEAVEAERPTPDRPMVLAVVVEPAYAVCAAVVDSATTVGA